MLLADLDFDLITEAHLQRLIDVGEREGQLLELKSTTYSGSDDGKKEFLKDISSLANTAGGYLIIGITEAGGQASGIAPLEGLDLDKEVLRLEHLARDGIDPRIPGMRIRPVKCSGGAVLLIRVPKSWSPPHRISAKNSNRFWLRNSAGTHEASMDELRSLFSQSSTLRDRFHAFQRARLEEINYSKRTPIRMAPVENRVIVHVLPFVKFSAAQFSIDLEAAQAIHSNFAPMSAEHGHSHALNFDGLLTYRSGTECRGYAQLFRDGAVEAMSVDIVGVRDGATFLPSLSFEEDLVKSIPRFLDGLRKLEVPPPFTVLISLHGIAGAKYGIGAKWPSDQPDSFTNSTLLLPDAIIEDFGGHKAYQRRLRPSLDTLWNAAGRLKSAYFDDDGCWVGKVR